MSFSDETIQAVWEKAKTVANFDPNESRKDECDAWIIRSEYGNRELVYGWEIDHIIPDGGDDLSNLRPLQWKNNASRQDGKLTCPVFSNGDKNIDSSL